MTAKAQISWLTDGRLHLHHGPIDVIFNAEGPDHKLAYQAAAAQFPTLLPELVEDLPGLTKRWSNAPFRCATAQAMAAAVAPLATDRLITPMAAVAGAVADQIIGMLNGLDLTKAVVNNGGDIAFLLKDGQDFVVAASTGPITIPARSPVRGVATSGWRGRSQSLGIADAVTVLARSAARADAAATLIANAVDLPGHPSIARVPAHEIEAIPQLVDQLVTSDVGLLTTIDTNRALARGLAYAERLVADGLIEDAMLLLNGETRLTGSADTAKALLAGRS